ncbi:hypothetical protein FOZ63_025866, partial [Perkinsus olseni]
YDLRKRGDYNFSSLNNYLNDPLIMRELGALRPWRPDSSGVVLHLRPTEFARSCASDVELVLNRGLQVLIYAGDQDYLCNWLGNQAWTSALPWAHRAEFNGEQPKLWGKRDDDGALVMPVGHLKQYENFAFLRVYNAGHMVPMDKPPEALYMFAQFVEGSVVHFSGHQATESAIKLTSLGTFAGEQGTSSIKKFKYGCTKEQIDSERAGTCSLKMADPVWMVALRALSMVNNSDVEYNLLEKNCELFCCWCELGARSGIVNFASPEKRAIGQSDPERFRGLSSLTTSVVQSLGFRDAHVAAASAAVNTATQSALKHSDSVTALASVFLRTPSTKKDGNISRYRAIVAKVFASVPADLPKSVDEAVNSDDISRSISVVDAIVIDISENPRLLQNTEYITSPMTPDEWRSALQSALSNIDRVASRT